MFPLWYFQGTEQMKHISAITGAPKIASYLLLFFFVHSPADGVVATAIQSGGLLVAGLLGFVIAFREMQFRVIWPTFRQLLETLAEGWHLFVSGAAGTLYINGNIVLVDLIAGNAQAGYFSVADKIARGSVGLLDPITQAVFPHVSALTTRSKEAALQFLRRSLIAMGSLSFLGSAVLFVFAGTLGRFLFGDRAAGSLPTLHWMASLPLIIGVSGVLAIQTMIPLGLDRQLSRIYVVAGLISPLLAIPLIFHLGSQGAGISVVLVEAAIIFAMWTIIGRNDIQLLRVRARTEMVS
jgi:O-antigen/teichoic acid export membrane protein